MQKMCSLCLGKPQVRVAKQLERGGNYISNKFKPKQFWWCQVGNRMCLCELLEMHEIVSEHSQNTT